MKSRNKIELFSAIFEGVIPLLGYFFFDWSILEIVLFYILDLLANEYNFNLRGWYIIRKPNFFKGSDPAFLKKMMKLSLLSFLSFLALISIFYWVLIVMNEVFGNDSKDVGDVIQSFLATNFLLLPVLVLARHMQTKMQFVKPKLYIHFPLQKLIKNHVRGRFFLLFGLLILLFLPYYISNPIIILILIVLGKTVFEVISFKSNTYKA